MHHPTAPPIHSFREMMEANPLRYPDEGNGLPGGGNAQPFQYPGVGNGYGPYFFIANGGNVPIGYPSQSFPPPYMLMEPPPPYSPPMQSMGARDYSTMRTKPPRPPNPPPPPPVPTPRRFETKTPLESTAPTRIPLGLNVDDFDEEAPPLPNKRVFCEPEPEIEVTVVVNDQLLPSNFPSQADSSSADVTIQDDFNNLSDSDQRNIPKAKPRATRNPQTEPSFNSEPNGNGDPLRVYDTQKPAEPEDVIHQVTQENTSIEPAIEPIEEHEYENAPKPEGQAEEDVYMSPPSSLTNISEMDPPAKPPRLLHSNRASLESIGVLSDTPSSETQRLYPVLDELPSIHRYQQKRSDRPTRPPPPVPQGCSKPAFRTSSEMFDRKKGIYGSQPNLSFTGIGEMSGGLQIGSSATLVCGSSATLPGKGFNKQKLSNGSMILPPLQTEGQSPKNGKRIWKIFKSKNKNSQFYY